MEQIVLSMSTWADFCFDLGPETIGTNWECSQDSFLMVHSFALLTDFSLSQQVISLASQQGISQSICNRGVAMANAIIKTNPIDMVRLSMLEFTHEWTICSIFNNAVAYGSLTPN